MILKKLNIFYLLYNDFVLQVPAMTCFYSENHLY